MPRPNFDPLREMVSLRDAFNSLLQDSFVRPGAGTQPGTSTLPLDVTESESDITVTASLPGIAPEDVSITVQGDLLTIRGATRAEEEKQGQVWLVRERLSGAFERSLALPVTVDSDKADAKFENGVLVLTLPKAEKERPKQIKIGKGL